MGDVTEVVDAQEQDDTAHVEIFENDIAMYLQLFCEEQGIEDMRKAPQSVWNAAMMFIKRNVFSDRRKLKRSSPLEGYNNNNYNNQYSNINQSNCNAYDIDVVDSICDYYIYICNIYDKGVTISGFCKLTGINEETIYDWGREDSRELSVSASEIYKKLSTEYEQSLEARLWSNKNPVAHMAIANRRFGWNLPGVSKEHADKKVLGNNDLPILETKKDSSSNCTKDLIEQKFEKPQQSQ